MTPAEGPDPEPLLRSTLLDSSVWGKVAVSTEGGVLDRWLERSVRGGRVAVCEIVVLELLRSARSTERFDTQDTVLRSLRLVPTGSAALERAREVQALLARRGQDRGVPILDLLIAASAELGAIDLVHYDHDYDLIADVSGQAASWFVPRGSLD